MVDYDTIGCVFLVVKVLIRFILKRLRLMLLKAEVVYMLMLISWRQVWFKHKIMLFGLFWSAIPMLQVWLSASLFEKWIWTWRLRNKRVQISSWLHLPLFLKHPTCHPSHYLLFVSFLLWLILLSKNLGFCSFVRCYRVFTFQHSNWLIDFGTFRYFFIVKLLKLSWHRRLVPHIFERLLSWLGLINSHMKIWSGTWILQSLLSIYVIVFIPN